MVGATPTGDAPTTSEWWTISLPTKERLILEIWWYAYIMSAFYILTYCTVRPNNYAHGLRFVGICCGLVQADFYQCYSGLLHWHKGNKTTNVDKKKKHESLINKSKHKKTYSFFFFFFLCVCVCVGGGGGGDILYTIPICGYGISTSGGHFIH